MVFLIPAGVLIIGTYILVVNASDNEPSRTLYLLKVVEPF